jgi:acyl-CoA reductase-like NAD-dependent aldehyde dehydrogenase
MGKAVAQTVAARLGKTLLELGGNNAIIISRQKQTRKLRSRLLYLEQWVLLVSDALPHVD